MICRKSVQASSAENDGGEDTVGDAQLSLVQPHVLLEKLMHL